MKNLEKFLEFNGKRIAILLADGTWWVAVKPICDALDVNYNRAYQNIQTDDILSQLFAKQQTVGADKKVREMICLPEKFIYGWLFSLRSDSDGLLIYKRKCYEVLFDHFHGALTGRMTALSEKSDTELRMMELQDKLQEKMLETEEYREMMELKKKQKTITKTLRDLDIELLTGQLSFNFS